MEYTKRHLQDGDKSRKLYLHFHGFPQSLREMVGEYMAYWHEVYREMFMIPGLLADTSCMIPYLLTCLD